MNQKQKSPKIFLESKFQKTDIQAKIWLENGVLLYVHRSGDAEGNDGKYYHSIQRNLKGCSDVEDDLVTVGWSCDIDGEVVVKDADALEVRLHQKHG